MELKMMKLMDMKVVYWTKTWLSKVTDCCLTGVTFILVSFCLTWKTERHTTLISANRNCIL